MTNSGMNQLKVNRFIRWLQFGRQRGGQRSRKRKLKQ